MIAYLSIIQMFSCTRSHTASVGTSTNYILQLEGFRDTLIASGSSSVNYINLIDFTTMKLTACLGNKLAHSQTICDIVTVNESLVGSCSRDGFLKIWDCRAPASPVMEHRVHKSSAEADVNALAWNGEFIAVSSSEKVLLIDFMTNKVYHQFTELHAEPITGLLFHSKSLLVTCSEDGMITAADIYDIVNEDDGQAPRIAMNTQGGVRGIRGIGDNLYAISSTEEISQWNIDGLSSRILGNVASHPLLEVNGSQGYVLDIYGSPGSDPLTLAGGSDGRLVLYNLADESPRISATFGETRGHTGVVRSSYRKLDGLLYTGGEDGIILEWKYSKDLKFESLDTTGPASAGRSARPAPY